MHFTIPGSPVAKARPRFVRTPKFVRTYTPKKSLNFEQMVSSYAHQAMSIKELQMLDRPIALTIDFFFSRPKSRRRKKTAGLTMPRIVKPDIDNLIKSILDGLNKMAFLDDAQVWNVHVRKFEVDDMPRTEITIEYSGEHDVNPTL